VTENELQKIILQALEHDNNIFVWRNNTGCITQEHKGKKRVFKAGVVGSADIIGLIRQFNCTQCNRRRDGVFLAIEVKSSKGELRDTQEAWLEKIDSMNGITLIVRPDKDDPFRLKERIERAIYDPPCPVCEEKGKLK